MSPGTPVTLAEAASLSVALDPVTAGRMLGLVRTTVYRLLRERAFPAPVRRLGRTWVVPTAGAPAYLGLNTPPPLLVGAGAMCA